MPYEIIYDTRVVREDLPQIPKGNKAQLSRAINERLTGNPVGLGKPLTGAYKGLWRLRVGDWRIIYEINGTTVTIFAIKRRNEKTY